MVGYFDEGLIARFVTESPVDRAIWAESDQIGQVCLSFNEALT